MAETMVNRINTADRIWWLRGSLSSFLFAVVFFALAYSGASPTLAGYATGYTLMVGVWMGVMYLLWPYKGVNHD